MKLPRFLLFGTKDTQTDSDKLDPRPVQVAPSGAMKIWIDGMRNTLSLAITAVVSSIPNVVISTMPNLTVASMPSLTANPTRPTLLAQVLLTGSDATLYTAAANWRDVIIYTKNVDTAARTCDLALNATYSDTTAIVKSMPIEVGGRVPVFLPALASAQVIRGLCDSANKVSVEIWGTAA